MVKVIFVCLGNICRSPMAEGVFSQLVAEADLSDRIQVDSAGTSSWHIGERAHPGTRKELTKHGIAYNGRARRISSAEYTDNRNYLIAMDSSNLADLQSHNSSHPRMFRLLDFASQSDVRDVPDPYYEGKFELVYRLIEDGCQGLLAMIREQEQI